MALYFQMFVALLFVFGCYFVDSETVEDHARFDCYPERLSEGEQAVNQTLCEARGCIWKQPVNQQVKFKLFNYNSVFVFSS
jgi:hypothetical protein